MDYRTPHTAVGSLTKGTSSMPKPPMSPRRHVNIEITSTKCSFKTIMKRWPRVCEYGVRSLTFFIWSNKPRIIIISVISAKMIQEQCFFPGSSTSWSGCIYFQKFIQNYFSNFFNIFKILLFFNHFRVDNSNYYYPGFVPDTTFTTLSWSPFQLFSYNWRNIPTGLSFLLGLIRHKKLTNFFIAKWFLYQTPTIII